MTKPRDEDMEEKDVMDEGESGTNEKAHQEQPVQNGKTDTRSRRRRLLWIAVALVILVVVITFVVGLTTGNKGDDVDTSEEFPSGEKVCSASLLDNKFDPRIMSVLSSEGDKVTYYGERDDEGIPVGNWTSAFIERADGNVHTVIFDETHSPGEIWFSNWSVLAISWMAPTTTNISLLVIAR